MPPVQFVQLVQLCIAGPDVLLLSKYEGKRYFSNFEKGEYLLILIRKNSVP